eukprot:1019051-Pelagomonas_calceolata.AAC.7
MHAITMPPRGLQLDAPPWHPVKPTDKEGTHMYDFAHQAHGGGSLLIKRPTYDFARQAPGGGGLLIKRPTYDFAHQALGGGNQQCYANKVHQSNMHAHSTLKSQSSPAAKSIAQLAEHKSG